MMLFFFVVVSWVVCLLQGCVSKIGGGAWCELIHGDCNNSGLFDFSLWSLTMV